MTDVDDAFRRELDNALELANEHPRLISIVDTAAGFAVREEYSPYDGRALDLVGMLDRNRYAACIDLSLCGNPAELLVYCVDGVLRSLKRLNLAKRLDIDSILPNLHPWSPAAVSEIRLWAMKHRIAPLDGRQPNLRLLNVVVYGVDALPDSEKRRLLAIVQFVRDYLPVRSVICLGTTQADGFDIAIYKSACSEAEVLGVLEELFEPSGKEQAVGFWSLLADELFSEKSRRVLAALIIAAFGSSLTIAQTRRVRNELSIYQRLLRERKPILATAEFAQLERDNSKAAAMAALFLTLLKIGFQALFRDVHEQREGCYLLFRLQTEFIATAEGMPQLTLYLPDRWKTYREDNELRAFFHCAMVGSEASVRPFGSATELRHCLLGLTFNEGETTRSWLAFLLELRNQVDAIETELYKLQSERRKSWWQQKEMRERRRQADADRASAKQKLLETLDGMPEGIRVGRPPAGPIDGEQPPEAAEAALEMLLIRLDEYLSIPRFPNEIRIAQDELKDERALLMNLVANTVGDTVRSAGRRVGGDQLELVLRAVSLLELLPEGQRDSDALETLQKILQRINDGLFGIEARFGLERIYLMAPQLKPRSCPQAEEVRDTLIQIGRKLIEALRSETEKAYDEAETLYQAAYADAVEVRARELMVRSAMGSVRCSALRSRKDAWCDYARAKAFVTIQLARTPFLADMMMPLPDLVFISYRSETREFVERLDESIAAELPQLKPWVDYGAIDQLTENFRPAMQLGLDRCRHAILVFSKEYFTSPWCTYEWSTLLARGEGNVQLHWLSVADPPAGVEQPHGAVASVEQMAERATGSSAQQRFITSQLQQILKIKPLYEHAVPLSDHAAIVPMIIDRLRQEIPRRGISAQ